MSTLIDMTVVTPARRRSYFHAAQTNRHLSPAIASMHAHSVASATRSGRFRSASLNVQVQSGSAPVHNSHGNSGRNQNNSTDTQTPTTVATIMEAGVTINANNTSNTGGEHSAAEGSTAERSGSRRRSSVSQQHRDPIRDNYGIALIIKVEKDVYFDNEVVRRGACDYNRARGGAGGPYGLCCFADIVA